MTSRRGRVPAWAGLGLAALLALACAPGSEPAAQDGRPSLVLVYLIDTLRADHLGAYGYSRDTSPALDAFAREAVLFERAHAQAPWTKPSVASLFTGLLPAYTDATEKHQRLPERVDTLAEAFSRAGWRTAGFVANPWVTRAFGFDQGFDLYRDVTREGHILLSDAEDMNAVLLPHVASLAADERHFLYVHVRDPHSPYAPPPPYDRLFDPDYSGSVTGEDFDWRLDVSEADRRHLVALYDGEIRYTDRAFGELLEALKARGLYERALVVVTSDHGEEFLEHARWEHGRDLYQTLIHVPLLIRFPGGAHAGTRVRPSVSLLDLFPTLAEAAGLETGPRHGSSLPPLLTGEPGRGPVVAHESRLGRELFSVRDGRFKLIQEIAPAPRVRLFDLAEDAGEQRDVAARQPERVAALSAFARRVIRPSREGTNLRFFGDGRRHRLRGSLTTPGRIVRAEGYQLGEGDVLLVGPDRRRVEFEIGLDENRPFRLEGAGRSYDNEFIDERGLRVTTRPPDAPLELALELDGGPFPAERVLLGFDGARAASLPASLDPGDARLRAEHPVLPLNPAYRRAAPVHARVWRVEGSPDEAALLSDELEQRLRALGYLDP